MSEHQHIEPSRDVPEGTIITCECGQQWKAYRSPYGQIENVAILSPELQAKLDKVYASYDAAVKVIEAEREKANEKFDEAEYSLGESRWNQEYEIYQEAGVEPPMLYA